MCRLLVALVVGLVSASALAQGTAFYPLGAGDTWTYEQSLDELVLGGAYDQLTGYRRVEARADTLIDSDAYRLVDVTYLDYALRTTATARCAVRAEPTSQTPTWIALRGDCGAPESGRSFLDATAPTTYSVGGVVYNSPLQLDNAASAYSSALAPSVGMIRALTISGTGTVGTWQRLHAATVGGMTYGVAPDSTAWREFAPLAVGTRHVYRWVDNLGGSSSTSGFLATSIVGTRSVDGHDYAVAIGQSYSSEGVLLGTSTSLRRHDDARGCVVSRQANGSEECLASGDLRLRSHAEVREITLGSETFNRLAFAEVRRTGFLDGQVLHASGIGHVYTYSGSAGGPGGGFTSDLVLRYAEVDGVSYGTLPAWVTWPVADEPAPSEAGLSIRLAGANPTSGLARLRVASPAAGAARLAVVDVLGRTVVSRDLTLVAGEADLTVDLTPQAAGVYRVRVTGDDGAVATLAVTRY